ncbi:MAG TPA: histidinol dehydrogenase [Actinomycetota bacterium]|nr:histidinol dehydrogenase [Actinomycetota bacterium]
MLELIDGRDQLTPVHVPRPRPGRARPDPAATVAEIIEAVRLEGDPAVLRYTAELDSVDLTQVGLRVDGDTITRSVSLVRPELIAALEAVAANLRAACERALPAEWINESDGVLTGEVLRPMTRAGVYVPGGRASYPSSVMMAAVPAQSAGVKQIAVATPPGPGGDVPEAILAACALAGITEVYRMGGAQSIAALAYGTETVRPVDIIVGPGNVFVATAKRMVSGQVAIDSEAGPTELAIVADEDADPIVLAADLVAQAEHGPGGTHALITWSASLAERVIEVLEVEVDRHPRADDVENALIEGGKAVLVRDLDHALDTANAFAPEHLQLSFSGARAALPRIRNAGAIFVGYSTPVAAGDYAAGTNHVLPTGGTARWSSGLGVNDFLKRIYVAEVSERGLAAMSGHVDALATAEGLGAHARSVRVRLGDLS